VGNYRASVLRAREDRDTAIEQAREQARRLIAEAGAVRDREIRELRAENPRPAVEAIGAAVGCSRSQIYELLQPARRAAYNERRRRYWQEQRHLKAAAS
jgi:regulator of protease activity HflC (stomatin/prohibitin superfamily)